MKKTATDLRRPKLHFSLLLLVAFLLSACAGSEPLAAPPQAGPADDPAAETALPAGFQYPEGDTLRVATWNAEHFVDAYDNPYINNPREDKPPKALPERVDRFVEVIRRLDADVVVLQEFESAAYLERLAEERFPEMGYEFFAGTESRDWYQNVVLMSRLPLGVVTSYASVTTPVEGITDREGRLMTQRLTNNRMWLADVLARPGYTFTLAGLHLKAGGGARNASWRTGQIHFLRREFVRLLDARPSANLLVAGDLNTYADSHELALLLGQTRDAQGSLRLINPLAGRFTPTYPSENPRRQLDYILVNENMLPELIEGSVRVALPLPQRVMARASDHLPVVGAFIAQERSLEATPPADAQPSSQ